MIYCTQIDKLNMHYIAKYQYVKLLHYLRVHHTMIVKFGHNIFFTLRSQVVEIYKYK